MSIRSWRIALIAVGLALMVVGGLVLLDDVSPTRYGGILLWLAGAIIIHDGIIAGIVIAVNLMLRKAGRRVPLGVLAIVQGAVVVGAIIALIAFPQIIKQGIGTLNPTILPLDYWSNLAVFYAALITATGLAIVAYFLAAARRRRVGEVAQSAHSR